MATYQVTITYPNDKATDILNTVTDYLGYKVTFTNEETGEVTQNPQTRKQFLDASVRDYLKNCYSAGKAKAADTARVTAVADADAVSMTV